MLDIDILEGIDFDVESQDATPMDTTTATSLKEQTTSQLNSTIPIQQQVLI